MWTVQGKEEHKLGQTCPEDCCSPIFAPNTFRSGRVQPPKRQRLGFPANLRGARARRTRRQKGADCDPPPEEHPPDEHAEFRVPAS